MSVEFFYFFFKNSALLLKVSAAVPEVLLKGVQFREGK